MSCWTAPFLVAFCAFSFVMSPPNAKAAPTLIREGELFPDLVFPALENGVPRSMADYRGQKVVLHVFASW